MIVRIFGEGQWRIDADSLDQLNQLDERVSQAIESGDQEAMQSALSLLLDQVRQGEQVADDDLAESDLIIPDASATLDEVRAILDESGSNEGLIPG